MYKRQRLAREGQVIRDESKPKAAAGGVIVVEENRNVVQRTGLELDRETSIVSCFAGCVVSMGQDYSGSVIVCRDKGEIILKSTNRIHADV